MYKARIKMQDDEGNWLLPNEVLLHILKLVPNRKNVAMSCTKFYNLSCNLERNARPLKINTDRVSSIKIEAFIIIGSFSIPQLDEFFDSIIASQRQFNVFLLDTCKVNTLEQYWRLKTIFFKYGSTISDLSWDSCKLSKAEILTLLNFLPNLSSLSAISWRLPTELYEEPAQLLNLQKLVKLKIAKTDKTTVDFFATSLRSDTVKDLNLQGDPESFLINQQSVTKLELNVEEFNSEELLNMKLTHLRLKLRRYKDGENRSVIHNIIENQPNLLYLDLVNCEGCFDGDDAAFAAVCRLDKLESLKLNIDDLSAAAFMEHFPKLHNLKSLDIESLEHNFAPIVSIIDELSRLGMPRLEKLRIYLCDVGVPLDRIERMGTKFRSLTDFTIRCDHPLPLDCYLNNMKQLESLHIDYHYSKEFAKLCNKFDDRCSNLKHLFLHGFGFGSDDVNWNELNLLKLTEVVPNLEVLELDAAFPFNTDFIFKIMEKFKNLTVITNWSMIQSGDNYSKFDEQSILDLSGIAGMMKKFSIELRLKAIDMDVSRIKEEFNKDFHSSMTRIGNFYVIRLEKK